MKMKIRLNNIIWREWFLQCRRYRRPIVCRFEFAMCDNSHKKPEAVVLEGRYWSRSYESVITEYNKWRKEYRRPSRHELDILQEVLQLADQLERGVSINSCYRPRPHPTSSLQAPASSSPLTCLRLQPHTASSLQTQSTSSPLGLQTPPAVSPPAYGGLDDVLTDQLFSYFLSRPQDFQPTASQQSQKCRSVSLSAIPNTCGPPDASFEMPSTVGNRPRVRRIGVSYPTNSSGSILTTLLQQSGGSSCSAGDLAQQQQHLVGDSIFSGRAAAGRGDRSNRSSSGSSTSDHAPMDTSSINTTIQEFANEIWDIADTLADTASQQPIDCSQRSNNSSDNNNLQQYTSASSLLSSNILSSLLFSSSAPVNLSLAAQLSPLSPTSPVSSLKHGGLSKLEELLCLPIRDDAQFQRPMGQPRTSAHMRKLVQLDRNPRRASTGSLPASQAHNTTQRTWNYKSGSAASESRHREIDKRRAPYINQGLCAELNQAERSKQDSTLLPAYSTPSIRAGAGTRLLRQLKREDQPGADYGRRSYQSVKSFDEFMSQQSTIPEELGFTPAPGHSGRKYSGVSMTSCMDDSSDMMTEVKQEVVVTVGSHSPGAGVAPGVSANRRVSHITSEQKRRRGINEGFDLLDTLCCSATGRPTGRTSRAAILKNGAEVCRQLKTELCAMDEEKRNLKSEIEALTGDLGNLQQQLPAGGARTSKSMKDKLTYMLDQHMASRASKNWIYSLFGELVLKKLFSSYIQLCSNTETVDLKTTVLHWLEDYCSLATIRPLINQAVFELGKRTSILTDPAQLPEELFKLSAAKRPGFPPAKAPTSSIDARTTETIVLTDLGEFKTVAATDIYANLPNPSFFG